MPGRFRAPTICGRWSWQRHAASLLTKLALDARLRSAVAEIVKRQVACGLDVVNDGELSKPNFTDYVSARIAGCENRPGTGFRRLSMTARDETKFAEYFAAHPRPRYSGGQTMPVCVDKLRYVGQAELARDLDNFKAALAGVTVAEAFLPANTPGTIEHWMGNEHYESDEAFLFAIAEAMREEYNAIVDAGFLLQIDDPDLPDGWACLPKITVPEYRKYAALRIDALNHALRDIPKEKVRLHVCWGSFHGPHHDDIPLRDIIDLIFRVRAGSYSIEASNPCHEHEWRVFEDVKLAGRRHIGPGRRRPLHRFYRASRPRRRASGALRQARRPRERAGRHRLRPRHAGRPPLDLLGQVRSYGRRRAARDKDPLGPRLTGKS